MNDEYPYNVFPSDILRRTVAHLSHPDEPARSLAEVYAAVTADEHTVIEDESGRRAPTIDEVREALNWNVDVGYVVSDGDAYRMTDTGLAALCE